MDAALNALSDKDVWTYAVVAFALWLVYRREHPARTRQELRVAGQGVARPPRAGASTDPVIRWAVRVVAVATAAGLTLLIAGGSVRAFQSLVLE